MDDGLNALWIKLFLFSKSRGVAAFASCVAKGGRRKQGLVPDIGVHFG